MAPMQSYSCIRRSRALLQPRINDKHEPVSNFAQNFSILTSKNVKGVKYFETHPPPINKSHVNLLKFEYIPIKTPFSETLKALACALFVSYNSFVFETC